MGGRPWYWSMWRSVDGTLRAVSRVAKRLVRTLRWLRFFLIVGIITILTSAVFAIVLPQYWPYLYAASVVFLAIPLFILLALVALPLRAKSIVRLIDMGYPANTKEMAIRFAARKLHEQSIESEELLMKTALNESRKLLRKYRERAERLKQELEEAEQEAKDATRQAQRDKQ